MSCQTVKMSLTTNIIITQSELKQAKDAAVNLISKMYCTALCEIAYGRK